MAKLFRGATHASKYSQYRFTPPKPLLEYIMGYLKSKIPPPYKTAIDVGCGTGQSTIGLAPFFESVTGFDVSEEQLKNAEQERSCSNITYKVSKAEKLDVPDNSVQLITIGQALHWFNTDEFFQEVNRILVPNGVAAAYGYLIPTPKTENIEESQKLFHLIAKHLHDDILGQYWHPNRYKILLNEYASVPFLFEDVKREKFVLEATNTVSEFMGYLSSWSAYEALRKKNKTEATSLLKDIEKRIMNIVGSNSSPDKTTVQVETNFFLLVGRKA